MIIIKKSIMHKTIVRSFPRLDLEFNNSFKNLTSNPKSAQLCDRI